MNLDQIYHRCGLKQPEKYLNDLVSIVLFPGCDEYIKRDLILHKRRTGRTTNLMMEAIRNLYLGQSTLIIVPTLGIQLVNSKTFENYAKCFPDLVIERTRATDDFIALFHEAKPRVTFVARVNGIIQSSRIAGRSWDVELEDVL